jgi:hypothetical protein
MSHTARRLFTEGDLSNLPFTCQERVLRQVEAIPKDQFRALPEEDLVQHVVSLLQIEPLTVYLDDRMSSSQSEIKVDLSGDPRRQFFREGPHFVPGIRIKVDIPFTGDPQLFKIRPGTLYIAPVPDGEVISAGSDVGKIQMTFDFPADADKDGIKKSIDEQLGYLRAAVDAQRPHIDQFNSQLEPLTRQAVQNRRARLVQFDKILEHLDIPIHRREGEPSIQPIAVKKRIMSALPPPPQGGFKPEPGIGDDVFEDILAVIRHGGRSFERTPGTYIVHDEEELRDIVLSHLNVYFLGGATGETFRKKGKTDILIQDQDRSAFVGECKVWQGPQSLQEAIDQLLGYLTWRDCKAALILFNKHNRSLGSMQESIPATFASHPRHVKSAPVTEMGEWRFVLRSQEDDSRLVHCHVFLFDLFVEKEQ